MISTSRLYRFIRSIMRNLPSSTRLLTHTNFTVRIIRTNTRYIRRRQENNSLRSSNLRRRRTRHLIRVEKYSRAISRYKRNACSSPMYQFLVNSIARCHRPISRHRHIRYRSTVRRMCAIAFRRNRHVRTVISRYNHAI